MSPQSKLLTLDKQRRVSLGKLAHHDRYLVEEQRDGTLILRPEPDPVEKSKPYWERECHLENRELCWWHCSPETWLRDAKRMLAPWDLRDWLQRPDTIARLGELAQP